MYIDEGAARRDVVVKGDGQVARPADVRNEEEPADVRNEEELVEDEELVEVIWIDGMCGVY